jgi:hypothetical protein
MHEGDLITKATRAHAHWCRARGCIEDAPSVSDSEVTDDGVVVLRNVNGVLARYRVGPSGRLRRLPDEE